MKFGKVAHLDQINFDLPDDPPRNTDFLAQLRPSESLPKVYIGCTGWSMKEWIGTVYPKGTKTKDYLKQYSKQFNTIELNTTHYRTPDQATIDKWYQEAAPDFKFCPKIPQSISHRTNFAYGSGNLLHFCDSIQGLKEKLGCCFMQLPPYFAPDRLTILKHFLQSFPDHIPLAVEVRHEDWFKDEATQQALFGLLEEQGVTAVITDVAGRRDVLHQQLTTQRTMIRFVGNGLVPSDYTRIDAWVQRLKTWFAQGLQEVYFFPHEPDNILAPELALYVYEQLQQHCEVIVRGPNLDNNEPQQMSLF